MSDRPRHPYRTDASATGCRKRGFRSKGAALSANRHNNRRLRAYLCERCHLWHVTGQVGKYA